MRIGSQGTSLCGRMPLADAGQVEIVQMKKEIHRMELRYDILRKKQEEYIKEMEQSVFKRETI